MQARERGRGRGSPERKKEGKGITREKERVEGDHQRERKSGRGSTREKERVEVWSAAGNSAHLGYREREGCISADQWDKEHLTSIKLAIIYIKVTEKF